MMNKLIKMEEYCLSVRDGTHDTPKPTEEGFFLVTSRAVKNNSIDFCSCYYISEKDYKKINERSKVDQWDVLMTMIGTVGRLLLVKNEPEYAIKNMALFKVGNEDRAKWLYYYLSTSAVQSYFEMIASGTSQHFIGLGHLRKLKIEDYNNTSKKITDFLSTFDSLIEVNNKRIKVLEQMAENLYKEWFVRFRFPGHESAEFENGIPKGWIHCKFNEIYNTVRGVSYSSDEIDCDDGMDLINLKNIQAYGGFRKDGTKKYCGRYKSEQIVEKNSLVMGVTDMTQERRTVGSVALVPDLKGVISADLILLQSEISNVFSYYHFKVGGYSRLFSEFGNGANVIHLKPDLIRNQKILVPTNSLVNLFEKKATRITDQINNLEHQIDILIKQRDLLLPRLMSGKLEV